MNALDLILIESALPAAALLLYALVLDVHDALTQHGLLPLLAVDKSMRSVHAHTSKQLVSGKTPGLGSQQDIKRAA
jgi:hypothetical protein